MQTILVASDGSAAADRALRSGIELARAFHAPLHIVTAGEVIGDSDLERFGRAEHATIGDMRESESRKVLARAGGVANEMGWPAAELHFAAGDAAKVVLDIAAETWTDVIVVGKRGRGHLAGLLLGSVSQKLVSLAPCAVMVVP